MALVTATLAGALAGQTLVLDDDELTFGLLEDMQTSQAGQMLDTLARAIVGGDAVPGATAAERRQAMRRLKPAAIRAIVQGVGSTMELPKS